MTTAPRWRSYLRFWRHDVRADVDDELRFHFESRIEELIEQGVPPDAARARALGEFGDVAEVRQGLVAIGQRVARRRGRLERLDGLQQDVRFAIRSLSRSAGVTLAILGTLTLGVGLNATMFTLLDSIFVRMPAGVVAPEGLRRVWYEVHFRTGTMFWPGFSYGQYKAVVEALQSRGSAATYMRPATQRIGTGEEARTAQLSYANREYFSLLGVHTSIGRLYSPEEAALEEPAHVAVVSHQYWQDALGGDSSIVGKSIRIRGDPFTIIGVAAESFRGIDLNAADIWIPLAFLARDRGQMSSAWWKDPNVNGFQTIVRPAAGVSDGELEARITAALRRPEVGEGRGTDTTTMARFGSIVAANGPGEKVQEDEIAIRLSGVAIIVLLIACANVVNLLLTRAVRRRREIAVRLALGISRARLIRLLVAESVLLAVVAALLALLVSAWAGVLLRQLLFPDVHWAQFPLDWPVTAIAVVIAVVAGLVAGFIPAIQSASPELTGALKMGSGDGVVHRSRLRTCLVVTQAALSVVLLVGAALFVRSLANVRRLDIGFDAQRLVLAEVHFDSGAHWDSSAAQRFTEVYRRAAALPHVEAVAMSSLAPMEGFSFMPYFVGVDSMGSRKGWMPTATFVTPRFFAATGMRIVRGRDFPDFHGDAMPRAVILNEAMARGLFADRDPIGQCIHFKTRSAPCYGVLAVVEDSRRDNLIEETAPQYYLPLERLPEGERLFPSAIELRVSAEHVATVEAAARSLIRQEFPAGNPSIRRLADYLEPQYRPWQLGAALFTCFGLLALVVAVIGIYSTVSYSVSQRLHEFGVRIALGANVGDVLRLVVGQGVRVVTMGVVVGVALALISGRLVASLLYGVAPSDPLVLAGVVVMLLAVGALAALVPAWRAARVDPVSALRAD